MTFAHGGGRASGRSQFVNYCEGKEGGLPDMEGKAVDARCDGRGSQPTGQTEVAGVVGVYFVYFCAAWFSRIQFSVFT